MQIRNTQGRYGWVSIILHWGMALLLIGLFILGKYMITLDYYDPLYLRLPDLHRSIGVFAAMLLLVRFVWRQLNPVPQIVGSVLERNLALWIHRLFYLLLLGIVLSGYLTSTADGHALSVFGWFDIPAVLQGVDNLEDQAGAVHEYLTWSLVFFVLLHMGAALKHHYIDKDFSLKRMLGFAPKSGAS